MDEQLIGHGRIRNLAWIKKRGYNAAILNESKHITEDSRVHCQPYTQNTTSVKLDSLHIDKVILL